MLPEPFRQFAFVFFWSGLLIVSRAFSFFVIFGAASPLMFLWDFMMLILDLLPVVPSLLPFFVAYTFSTFGIDKDL